MMTSYIAYMLYVYMPDDYFLRVICDPPLPVLQCVAVCCSVFVMLQDACVFFDWCAEHHDVFSDSEA